ncbi:MAG: hypothetical protein GY719_05535 [bacterium]|nr:hypothetical protein [bacterium]
MSDPRKRACDELARLLASGDGARTARLLQLTETLASPEAPTPEVPGSKPDGPRPISIWVPRQRGGELIFERPEPLPLGDHYALRRAIEAKKARGSTRVCLFGESVAAGYLYAPHLTPAGVLNEQLGTTFEVIDLARTNETLASMRATIEASFQLDPDLLVIFAGNNWNLLETPAISPWVPGVRSRQRYAQALRRDGLDGPAELARRQITARAGELLAAVAELTRRRIPVIVVVPEVNLADWHDRQPVTWLPGDGSRRWHASYAEARSHLKTGRHRAALAVAEAMLELDGGRCPASHRLRVMALTTDGRLDEARRAAESEVTAADYPTLAFLSAPRAATWVQEFLRRASERHGFATVDLPRLFAEYPSEEDSESPLPGRSLFLDYCHLSAEGIELAMGAVADEILSDSDANPEPPTPVEPAVEALAKLGAAVHGAHRLLSVGDKRPHVEHWCREALAADPQISEAMRDLLRARCAPGPAVLTAAQQRNLASPHRLLLQHGWRWNHLDVEVIEALCTALEEAGHPIRDEIETLLLKHHAVGRRGVDLTRPPYLWEPLERFFPEATARRGLTGRATYRSPWPESGFCLITGADSDVALELTVRLPSIEGTPGGRRGEITVRVNGTMITTVPTGERWGRETIELPQQHLRRVINRVTLSWPPLPTVGAEVLESAIRRLESGVEADLHPVFGEVFSLMARRAQD